MLAGVPLSCLTLPEGLYVYCCISIYVLRQYVFTYSSYARYSLMA